MSKSSVGALGWTSLGCVYLGQATANTNIQIPHVGLTQTNFDLQKYSSFIKESYQGNQSMGD